MRPSSNGTAHHALGDQNGRPPSSGAASSKTSARSRPRSLARYSARSASWSRSSAPRLRVSAAGDAHADRALELLGHRSGTAPDPATMIRWASSSAADSSAIPSTHDDELVTAESGQRVSGAQVVGESGRHGQQHPVTDPVAEGVVDDLEPVEVEVEHRQHTGCSVKPDEYLAESVHQHAAVRDPGQRIGGPPKYAPPATVRFLPLSDVPDRRTPTNKVLVDEYPHAWWLRSSA